MSGQSIERIASDSATNPLPRPEGVVCTNTDCTNYGQFSNCFMRSCCGEKCRNYHRVALDLFRSESQRQQ